MSSTTATAIKHVDESEKKTLNRLEQWVTGILNVETKSEESLDYLNSILRPIEPSDLGKYHQTSETVPSTLNLHDDETSHNRLAEKFSHQIIFKINEKVYIDVIKIYVKVSAGSSILKIEALNNKDEWFLMWKSNEPIPSTNKKHIFKPEITKTPFKTDIIRMSLSGSLYLIDGIEITGNTLAVNESLVSKQEEKFRDYSLLARHLHSLIENELFADVYFEVEGRIIPAHRNILTFRSDYFRAMLSKSFKEYELITSHNPIYLKNLSYDVFVQILTYLYTGHVECKQLPIHVFIDIFRAADLMNLTKMAKLCLFHLSEIINQHNVIKIYKEACESQNQALDDVLVLCYEVIMANFSFISRTEEFCSLQQDLMLKMIENVVPKLARLTSSQINNEQAIIPPSSENLNETINDNQSDDEFENEDENDSD